MNMKKNKSFPKDFIMIDQIPPGEKLEFSIFRLAKIQASYIKKKELEEAQIIRKSLYN